MSLTLINGHRFEVIVGDFHPSADVAVRLPNRYLLDDEPVEEATWTKAFQAAHRAAATVPHR